MASEEYEEEYEEEIEESEEEEEISLLDVISTYRHDADKIVILARSIETILHYTERLEANAISINNYIPYISDQIKNINTKIDDLENRFKKLVDIQMQSLQQGITGSSKSIDSESAQELHNEMTGLRSKIVDLESIISSLQSQVTNIKQTAPVAPAAPVTGIPPVPPTPQRQVVEESLLKPSSFSSSSTGPPAPRGPAPMGGMSVRMALMQEVKARLGKSTGGPTGGAGPMGIKKEYVPKIHQPRKAKSLDTGLVGKMNKLLDEKFQKQLGGGAPQGPPSVVGGGPPTGPPRTPPSVTISPPSATIVEEEEKDKKKKGKKKDDKKKKISDRLASIDAVLKDKLG